MTSLSRKSVVFLASFQCKYCFSSAQICGGNPATVWCCPPACVLSNLTGALSIQASVLGNSFSMCLHNMQFFTAGSRVACGLCFIRSAGKRLFLCRTHQFVLDVFWLIQRDGVARWHGAFGRIPILFEMGFMIRCVSVCMRLPGSQQEVHYGCFFFHERPLDCNYNLRH